MIYLNFKFFDNMNTMYSIGEILRNSFYSSDYCTAWKVFKYGVFSGSYFSAFGMNTEIYAVNP